ncbi:SDR family NAD(P)-dependent oxidoreductase [Alloyangia pacifica]|uniref:3-oxoacyl-[acyl-carrier protein] reductase n=1 Tax=Alloyangia pacifica TaxID=311180 RepID=A0A1I6QVY6_9RHOB|nr:SDR family oxidoreductase [Alloyangia pacifica]SDG01491.1 3-oxoacyl-[acyl-carrier protein] reductase [Alloyangia pacifica]SFS56609.1 3-oxoacyl-[acyl-carrier protein] reductase [Alloyangia pacifica]
MTDTPRTIAVLGGAGGIGRALVSLLAAQGDRVIVLDLPASLERHPVGDAQIALDATDEASVTAGMETLACLCPGGLQGFVHLAGWNSEIRPLAETPAAYFDEIVEGNLRSVFLATKAAAPLLAESGSMVLCSSGLGRFIRPGFGPYGASKAAVIALMQTFALELAPRVRVNAVGPGAVDTAFLRGGTGRSDESGPNVLDLERHRAGTPLGRVAEPLDIAGPIRFLLGEDAGFITGQVLWVNGGIYMP